MAGDEVRELLERVTAATGADRELDLDIVIALGFAPKGEKWERRNGKYDQGDPPYLRENRAPEAGPWPCFYAKPYTASADAALALVKRVLPKAIWTLEQDLCVLRVLTADDVAEFNFGYAGRGGKCTALAIVGALLTALQQDAETTRAGEGR